MEYVQLFYSLRMEEEKRTQTQKYSIYMQSNINNELNKPQTYWQLLTIAISKLQANSTPLHSDGNDISQIYRDAQALTPRWLLRLNATLPAL